MTTSPPLAWNEIAVANPTYFRFFRYFNGGLADVAEVEFRGVVQVTSNGLEVFRNSYGLPQDGSQDRATPAGDGVENLLKYAFNMIGTGTGQSLGLHIPNVGFIATDGSSGLPLMGINAAGKLTVTFVRRRATSDPGIFYAVEFSNSLEEGSWAVNGAATESATVIDAIFERVVTTDSLANARRRVAKVRVFGN